MAEKPQDQISSGVEALMTFVKDFGSNDEYTKLIMEIVLEELFDTQNNHSQQG
jgi:hypothetical protein